MSETDNETLKQAVDPPDNNGGTGAASATNLNNDSDLQTVDPPDNNGGTVSN